MKIALKAVNQLFVCAELGGGIYFDNGEAIHANRAVQNIWEEFKEIPLPEGGFALQTYSGNYVCAEDNRVDISTNRTEIGPWERFKWVGNKIQTHHDTFLIARLDLPDIPLQQTLNQEDTSTNFERIPLEAPIPVPGHRTGLVRADGRCAIDDGGQFHPLGLTFFWGLYGWKFERDRIHEHLNWLKQYSFDYLRILGEVNWEGRSILPSWPGYENILREFVDTAYDQYGLRSEITLVGGKYAPHKGFEKKVKNALTGVEHKVIHYEVCNEYTRLDKITPADLVDVGRYLRQNTPNLVALSRPDKYSDMIKLSQMADANMYTVHLRRSNHDNKWSNVRQGYDCKEFPKLTSNNEDQGPQSSVAELSNEMQLALQRATSITCGGAKYVLHVAQGVTGIADPAHNRPQNMWEVPNIDPIMRHVRRVDEFLPQGIENWQVVNNGRSNHPLPLDPRVNHPNGGFWEGNGPGSCNKNYATISGNKFVEVLLGVKNPSEQGSTLSGTARQNSRIKCVDFRDYSTEDITVPVAQPLHLEGRKDTMVGYVLQGNL